MSDGTSYDELPYMVRAYVQSSPDRLATIAALHGFQSPPVTACRVLELGCAAGGNIIPLAHTLPRSIFVGVDYSAAQIDQGMRDIEHLGLTNIRLHHANLLDLDDDWGRFDYIIAHGVYSWVPADVRDGIMALIARNLSPDGVAYVSYNTFPGWKVLGSIRDALLMRTRGITDQRRRVATARDLLNFLAAAEGDYSMFAERPVKMAAQFFKEGIDALGADGDGYLAHDLLEQHNDPVYFEHFVEHAEQHGLHYLGEAELADMLTDGFPPAVARALDAATSDPVERGQYVDFLRDQAFRQTLLCHDGADVRADVQPQAVFQLYVASRANVYADDAGVTFLHDMLHNVTFSTEHAPTSAAFVLLASNWPRAIAFGDIVAAIAEQGVDIDGEDLHILASNFVRAYGYRKELISLHSFAPPVATTLPERPTASAVALLHASRPGTVTNLYHEQVAMSDFQRSVLLLLDGTNDRAALCAALGLESPDDDERLDVTLQTLWRFRDAER